MPSMLFEHCGVLMFTALTRPFLSSLKYAWIRRTTDLFRARKYSKEWLKGKIWRPWIGRDFEHLIRELFAKEFGSKEGSEVKITRASRDRGVDAVVFDPDPLRGGKYVVQAKRYNNLVDVSAVRDLWGTVLNEGAARGILVTTSKYGRDAHDFVSNKPLTLIDGQNLLALLAKHGFKFKIELT